MAEKLTISKEEFDSEVQRIVDFLLSPRSKVEEKEKLKPCPFCGAKAGIKEHSRSTRMWFSVRCSNCYTETDWYESVESASNAWNVRSKREECV